MHRLTNRALKSPFKVTNQDALAHGFVPDSAGRSARFTSHG